MKRNSQLKWCWLALLLLIIDQASKYWAEHVLQKGVVTISSWFDLELAHNPGAAFSFLSDAGGWQQVLFFVLAAVVSIVLLRLMTKLKAHERHIAIAYALIISGAVGNAIDRVIYQYVIDFIHWFYNDWHWPYFNIADSAIFIGAALLFCDAFGWPFLNKKTEQDA